ncbi:MAG: hypothetical protein LBH18_03930, partial [Spirochaetaceae bacterium]|nr:hypothetical protein [Spirochaetaceae bacterium]
MMKRKNTMPPHKSRSPVPQTQKKKEVKKAAGRQRTVDIIVILFCFFGAAVSFFLFWRDLNLTLTKQNEAPVAVIRFKKNTAQRRFGNRVAWDSLKRDSPIYSG